MFEKANIYHFCKQNHISLLILFGSAVTGRTHKNSDIDIAIKAKPEMKLTKLELIYHLDDFFQGKDIDLIQLSSDTDPLLLYEIFSQGRPFYEDEEGLFLHEKLRAWKIYLDAKHIFDMQKQYLKNFVEKMSHVT